MQCYWLGEKSLIKGKYADQLEEHANGSIAIYLLFTDCLCKLYIMHMLLLFNARFSQDGHRIHRRVGICGWIHGTRQPSLRERLPAGLPPSRRRSIPLFRFPRRLDLPLVRRLVGFHL